MNGNVCLCVVCLCVCLWMYVSAHTHQANLLHITYTNEKATGVSAEELVTHLSLLAQRLPTLLCSVGEGEEGANLLAEVAWQLR